MHQKAALESVYFPLWTYNPATGKLKLDSADKSDTVSFAKNAISKELLSPERQRALRSKVALKVIFDEIRISGREGIRSDWCFHQHGPQPQFGNYGLSFLALQSRLAESCFVNGGIRYVVHAPREEIDFAVEERTGDFSRFMRSLGPTPTKGRVFSLRIRHGRLPSGAACRYCVFPCAGR